MELLAEKMITLANDENAIIMSIGQKVDETLETTESQRSSPGPGKARAY